MDAIAIRAVSDLPALRTVEDLQQVIWGTSEREIVPAHQLLAIVAAGGVVLGAFLPDGRMIGFCYGFVGRREGRPLFYSHMAGVLAEYRGREVGFQLKRAQREAALARGLDWMVWTFDPLQGTNAYFNLHRLGVRAERYLVNYYGEMADDLNRGVDSDRLEVDWALNSPDVVRRLQAARPEPPADIAGVSAILAASGDPPRPVFPAAAPEAPSVLLGVPSDFSALRRSDLGLAREWRIQARAAFQRCFARGYVAVDFVRGGAVGQYILRSADAR